MNQAKLLTKAEFAKLAGISTRTVERLSQDGKVKPERKKPLSFTVDSVAEYINKLLDESKNKEKDEIAKDKELLKLDGEARIKQAKAEQEELKLKELRGELHSADDVEAITTDHALYIRSMLLAMPGKLAVDLANISTAAEASERIRKEVYYILDCASEYKYDPAEYAKRVREREGWKEMNEEETD